MRAFWKDVFRTMRKEKKRFAAIMLITALGITMLTGLQAACDDLRISADAFFDAQDLHDIYIQSTLGLTGEDAKALMEIEGVEKAAGFYSETVHVTLEDNTRHSAEVRTLSPTGMDCPFLLEGALPVREGEIAVTRTYLTDSGKKIGDSLTFEEDPPEEDPEEDEEEEDPDFAVEIEEEEEGPTYRAESWTITGLVVDPMDINAADGAVSFRSTAVTDYVFFVVPEAAHAALYTAVGITLSDTAPMLCYTRAYEERVREMTDLLASSLQKRREEARTQDVKTEAGEKIDAAEKDAEEAFAEAEEELSDAREDLDQGRQDLEEGRAELEEKTAEARQEIEAGRQEIRDGYKELAEGDKELDKGQKEVDQGRDRLSRSEKEIRDAEAKLRAARKELKDQEALLQDGLKELEEKEAEAAEGLALLEASEAELTAGMEQLEEGEAALAAGRQELEAKEAELEAGQAGLDEAKAQAQAGLEAAGAALSAFPEDDSLLTEEERAAKEEISRQIAMLEETLTVLAGQEEALAEGRAGLEAGRGELDAREEELAAARQELENGLQAVEAGKAEAQAGMEALAAARADLEAGREELSQAKKTLDESDAATARGRKQLEEGRRKLAAAQDKIDRGRRQAAEGRRKLADAEKDLEEGERKLEEETADAEKELAEAEEELDDGEREYQENLEKFIKAREKARKKIEDARKEVEDIEPAVWYIQTRANLSGFHNVDSDAGAIESLALVFAAMFLAVAMLISLTTVNRMVDENRGLIGTYQALGFTDPEILAKYLFFVVLACLAGGLLGDLGGYVAFPEIIFIIFKTMYQLPAYRLGFSCPLGIGGPLVFLVLITGCALWTCLSALREKPAMLMRPKAPRAGSRVLLERIDPVWQRLSFLNKVTARNLFRYKKRMIMTVFGILGCSSLLVCGFGIRDSVTDLMPRQYEGVTLYDWLAVSSPDDFDVLEKTLSEDPAIEAFLPVQAESVTLTGRGGLTQLLQLYVVPDGSDLSAYVALEDIEGGGPLSLTGDGILVTRNASIILGFDKGSRVRIRDIRFAQNTFTVSGIAENYLGNAVYMTASLYEKTLGDFEPNAVMALFSEEAAAAERIAEYESGRALPESHRDILLSSVATADLKKEFSAAFTLINVVVVLLIVMSAALAFVVLFTLASTNISERERELATIKVLGFFDREVHLYVNKETLILTGIGTLLGMPVGALYAHALTGLLKMPSLYFAVSVHPASYVWSGILAMGFALLVQLITDRTLDAIDPVRALGSVE